MNRGISAKVLALLIASGATAVYALEVTNTVTRSLPNVSQTVPLSSSCDPAISVWQGAFDPGLPPGAVILSSDVSGTVDDIGKLSSVTIGGCPGPRGFSVSMLGETRPDGSFDIELIDSTTSGITDNSVSISGYNTVTYRVTDPLPPDITDTNVEDEVCEYTYDCDGNVKDRVCRTVPVGCSSCSSHGSPQPSFDPADFNVKISDVPVWHETAVGERLEIRMRFSNYGEAVTNRTFGPEWSCNWNSSVTEINAGTNRIVFPSGSIVLLTLSTNGAYLPPDALDGYLVKTGSLYRYERPDGRVWEYALSAGATNVYLLSVVRDVWSNTVSVTYTNDRLRRVTQTSPNSGRYLEFTYSGTNSRALSVSTEPTASRTATFSYSAAGVLTNVVDMGGYSYSYVYTNDYLAKVLKGATERLAVTYSATPNTWTATNSYWVKLADAGGFTRTFTWEFGAVKEVVTRTGTTNALENTYAIGVAGSRGRVLTGISRSNLREQFQYTAQGRVSNRVDRSGGVWKQGYNILNRRTSMTDPQNNTTTYVYDGNGVDLLYEVPPVGPVQQVMTYVPGKHVVATESNALGRVVTYAYNAYGQVTNSFDGRTTETSTYDGEGRLRARHRNGELVETNAYDAFGRLEWSRDAAGLEVTRTYDNLNRLLTQTYVNNGQASISSNQYDCCALSQVTDRRGNTSNFQFNDIGEKLSESNPMGLTTYYSYGLEGQALVISNSLQWTTRQYTPVGQLKRLTYPARPYDVDHSENYWYDNEGQQIKRQTLSGAFYKEDYDALGRKTGSYVPDGSTLAYGVEAYVQAESNRYDALGRLVWTRDIRGLAVSNDYNALGQITKKTYPDGSTEEWTFNTWGDSTSFKDRVGNVESNVYDALGRLIQRVDARQFSTYTVYTNADQAAVVSNSIGQVWRFSYDAEGRVLGTTHPDSSVETMAYDPMGNVTQRVRGGITAVQTYDKLGRQTSVLVGGLLVESNRYDQLGRLSWNQNADGLVLTNAWDNWGELMSRTWPGGLQESFQYGDRGLTNTLDRLNIAVRQNRDNIGRLVLSLDGATNAVSYAFVSNGINQLRYLWDGNSNRTAWAYDESGNPTNKLYADNSQDRYQFDRLNRLTNKLDAANVSTRYSYDANGNLTGQQAGSNPQVSFGYDGLNRRTNMVDGVGTTVWTFDALNRLTSESGPFGTTVAAGFDALGRLTSVAFSGRSWSYQYDTLSRITNIVANEGSYRLGYLGQGTRKVSIQYPNGVSAGMTYDALIRLTNLVYALGSSNLLALSYGYDNGDRRTNEVWSDGRKLGYAYDGAHQLLDSVSTGRASDKASYRYDKAGNPLRRMELGLGITNSFNNLNQIVAGVWTGGAIVVAGAVNYNAGTVTVNGVNASRYGQMYEKTNVTVSAGTNVLTAVYRGPMFTNAGHVATALVTVVVGTTGYGHDANGNLTNDATFVYRYDAMNQLTSVVNKASGSTVLACRYDGLGRRVQVTRDGTNTERYVYLPGTFLVVAVLDGTNGVKEVYTHGPDLSGSIGGAGGIGGILHESPLPGGGGGGYYHADANGNIVAATSSSGTVVAAYQYTPFGRVIARTGDLELRYQFSSKEYDAQAGLNYFGYRSYNPALGRWLHRDPIGVRGGENLYGFVGNRVPNAIENLGLCWSSARAVAHYQNPLGKRRVSLEETGCLPIVQNGLIHKFDDIWLGVHKQAAADIKSKNCGSILKSWRVSGPILDGAKTPVYWIGGISLRGRFECKFSSRCKECKITYECKIEYSMEDKFEDPLDFNGAVRLPLPGLSGEDIVWPDPTFEVGLNPFVVYHTWKDHASGTAPCAD
jgi:RHS repeat-associated protein